MPPPPDPSIMPLVIFWPVLLAVVSVILWRRSERGIGLVFLYMALFTTFHWTAATVQLLPFYTPLYDPAITQIGFNYSFIGLLFFVLGAVIIGPFLLDFARHKSLAESVPDPAVEAQPSAIPRTYVLFGIASYFVVVPLTAALPSFQAFTTGSVKLLYVGVMLLYYQITMGKSSLPRWLVLIPMLVWPLVTITNEGFLGFGLAGPLVVGTFIFFTRPTPLKVRHLVVVALIAYLLVSVISTYMYTRDTIRDTISSGGGLVDRLSAVYDSMFTQFALFDLRDPDRANFIENRLDLSYLAGAAIARLNAGKVNFSYGETLVDSALALIPRAVWPDKPFQVGGNALVTQYTGIQFAEGTSVGAGQVMELYINFGMFGIIAGFTILGIIISLLDQSAARALRRGDSFRFALFVVPAFGLLLIGDNLLAIVGSTVSSVVTVVIVNTAIRISENASRRTTAAPTVMNPRPPLQSGNQS